MNMASSWTNYEERLNRVTAYIHDNLDEELDLHRLADVACLSPYHWHRIYHAVYGETLAATVKRLRLHRAAGYLAQSSMPIAEVADKSGYPNLQSFTRVFSSVFGVPPAQYRKNGSHAQFHPTQRERSLAMYDVKIATVPEMTALTVEHLGSYMQIGKAFDTLYGCLAARGLLTAGIRSVGVYYDDPSAVPEETLRSRAGAILSTAIPAEAPLASTSIPGGTYAVLRHRRPYADMRGAYQWLYGEWLVHSGREAADAPVFEEYLNNPRDTAPTELLTDIYLPLAN